MFTILRTISAIISCTVVLLTFIGFDYFESTWKILYSLFILYLREQCLRDFLKRFKHTVVYLSKKFTTKILSRIVRREECRQLFGLAELHLLLVNCMAFELFSNNFSFFSSRAVFSQPHRHWLIDWFRFAWSCWQNLEGNTNYRKKIATGYMADIKAFGEYSFDIQGVFDMTVISYERFLFFSFSLL